MNGLLLDERPLVLLPSLVKLVGNTDKAIVLQQIHFLSTLPGGHEADGHHWVWNTYEQLQTDWMPMWTVDKIRKLINALERDDWILSEQFNKSAWDRTKFYRINYEKLSELRRTNEPYRSGETDHIDIPESAGSSLDRDYDQRLQQISPIQALVQEYESKIGLVTPLLRERIEKDLNLYPLEWLSQAIDTARSNGGRSWSYISKILEGWKLTGLPQDKKSQDGRPPDAPREYGPDVVIEL